MGTRTYIRLHDGMPDHPKVIGLSDRAFRLYVEAMCWCSRFLTDGMVTTKAMKEMRAWSPSAIRELAEARLVENGVPAGWVIHDYTDHQYTSAEMAESREVRREAGVVGNHERWHVARGIIDPSCEMCAIDDASHVRGIIDRTRKISDSSLAHHRASREEDLNSSSSSSSSSKPLLSDAERAPKPGSDDDPDFTAFWTVYQRKVGKGQARKAWRSAVIGKRVDPQAIIAAAEKFRDWHRNQGTDRQFIPHPATWLNGERWADEQDGTGAGRVNYPNSPWAN